MWETEKVVFTICWREDGACCLTWVVVLVQGEQRRAQRVLTSLELWLLLSVCLSVHSPSIIYLLSIYCLSVIYRLPTCFPSPLFLYCFYFLFFVVLIPPSPLLLLPLQLLLFLFFFQFKRLKAHIVLVNKYLLTAGTRTVPRKIALSLFLSSSFSLSLSLKIIFSYYLFWSWFPLSCFLPDLYNLHTFLSSLLRKQIEQ